MFNDSLMALVIEGVVEPREAYIKAFDKDGMLKMFENAGIRMDPTGAA